MEPNTELFCSTDADNPAVTNITVVTNGAVQHGNIPTGRLYDWLKTNASIKTAAAGGGQRTGTGG